MGLDEIIAGLRAAGAEFEDVEAKRAAGGVPESLASTMAAFANARGGPRNRTLAGAIAAYRDRAACSKLHIDHIVRHGAQPKPRTGSMS